MASNESEADRREASARLPAGLEQVGRDENLVSGPNAHPTGARADRKHTVPGTLIPGGPRPADSEGEAERVRDAADRAG